MALNKEVWINDLMENLIPDESWMSELRDLSSFVENNKLHIGEAGAMPGVLVNNGSWPITVPATTRSDTDNEKSLFTYDTENQVLRNAESVELAYDKRQSVILNHKNALRKKISITGAWNICPDVDGTGKVLLKTSGAAYVDGINKKRAKFADILEMQKSLDAYDLPREGRIAVLSPQHLADLMLEDLSLYKMIIQSGQIFDFKLYRFNGNPYFTVSTTANTIGAKAALTTAYVNTTHGISSMFFQKQEAFKAIGTAEMYVAEKTPTERGDVIGFQVRALVQTMRASFKFAGGLVTVKES